MRRERNYPPAKGFLAEELDELGPSHSLHAFIGDQQIEGIGFDPSAGERLLTIGHARDLVAIALERNDHGERDGAFVFCEQDIQRGKPSVLGVHGEYSDFISEIREKRQ